MENLENAVPDETVKIKTHYARIVVDGTADKPYYSIEWFDRAKQELCLGYSSYNIENVFNWLSEWFEIVEAPKTNADRIRAMTDGELAKFLIDADQGNFTVDVCDERFCDLDNCSSDCTAAALKWLQLAEGECV